MGCDPVEAMARIAIKAEEDRGETEPMTFNFNVLPAVSDVIVTRVNKAVKKGKIQPTEKAS
jgi:hypothetical protein